MNKIILFLFFISIILSSGYVDNLKDNSLSVKQSDSVFSNLIDSARDKSFGLKKRKYFLEKAYNFSLSEEDDSLKRAYLLKISFSYFKIDDSITFRKLNKKIKELASRDGDSITLAANYWDLGNYFTSKGVKDSAYYSYSKSEKIYGSLGKNYYQGLMLLNMAIIQSDLRDYTGSEVTTIRAIEILKPLEKYRQLYKCYNNLGIIFNELQEYDNALFYHNKALEYQKKIEQKNSFYSDILNNIGVVYEMQQEYEKAITNYYKALKSEDLKEEDTELYAMLLDNLAYSKFKTKDTVGVKVLWQESLHLRDSINDVSGKTINKLHLAEYHATYNDTIKALQLAVEAKELAENSKNYRDLLPALLLLSKLDNEHSNLYTQRYIALNAQLLKEERAIRDKFARIRFETDEFIEENVLLTEQNKRILIIGLSILLFGVLLYIIGNQRLKNIRLRLEKEQQKANEEIYNLMLTQQNKLDEGKRNEKKRMSEELHDGVLGNLYGIKMNLAVLNPQNNPDAVLKREEYIEGLANVIDEIRNVSHELHANAIDVNLGYTKLVEDLLIQKSKENGYAYEFIDENDTNWQEMPGDIKMNIYRIVQESIQNINKYAKANHVMVSLKSDDNFLHLIINDDGIGFNTKTRKDGIGIKNIKSRIDRLEGTVEFVSKLKVGTTIIIKIPYISIK